MVYQRTNNSWGGSSIYNCSYDEKGNVINWSRRQEWDDEVYIENHNSEYIYDDKDRLTYLYEDEHNHKEWITYDSNGFITKQKIKSGCDGGFLAHEGKAYYEELFYINEYSYYPNGQVKECLRYCFMNPYYLYDYTVYEQPDADIYD